MINTKILKIPAKGRNKDYRFLNNTSSSYSSVSVSGGATSGSWLEKYITYNPENDTIRINKTVVSDYDVVAYADSGQDIPSIFDSLPVAITTSKGLVQIGSGLSINNGILSANQQTIDYQTLSFVNNILSISNGNSVDLSGLVVDLSSYYTKTETNTLLNSKANTSHIHSISNITGLQTALDSKALLNGSSATDFSVKDLTIYGSVNHWVADTITVDDAKLQLNNSQDSATVSSGIDIYNGTSVISSLLYDTDNKWKAGGNELITTANIGSQSVTNSTKLGGYTSSDYPRKAENASITGKWLFKNGSEPIRLIGSNTGIANSVFLPFFESNGTVRQGYIGFGSSVNSDLNIYNDVSGGLLQIKENGNLTYNNNFGIGTGAPTEKLEVNGNIKATKIIATNVTDNSTTAANTAKYDGYGILGNRATFYITNANTTGNIKLGLNSVHGAGIIQEIYSDYVNIWKTLNQKSHLNVEGQIYINNTAPRVEFTQTDTQNKMRWVLDGSIMQLQSVDYSTSAYLRTPFSVNNAAISSTLTVSSSSRVGVGTGTPAEKLEVIGNIKSSGDLTATGKIYGKRLGIISTAGNDNNTGLSLYGSDYPHTYGIQFMQTSTTGYGTHGSVTDAWAMYFNLSNTANRGWIFRKNGGGNVASIDTAGNIVASSEVTAYSDRRLKENIRTLEDNTLDKVLELNPVKFNKIDDENKTEKIGLIAQELQKIYPEFVSGEETDNSYLSVNYAGIVSVLIKSIQELNNKVNKLENELKNRV